MVGGCTTSRPRITDRSPHVSCHDTPILRRATVVISFSTRTLIVPLASLSLSARSALAGSPDATYNNTLVSKNYRAFASSRSNLKSAGRRPRNARRHFSSSSRPGFRARPNSCLSVTWISIWSPSFSSSASTTVAGSRSARLLPHFATAWILLRCTHGKCSSLRRSYHRLDAARGARAWHCRRTDIKLTINLNNRSLEPRPGGGIWVRLSGRGRPPL